MKFRSPWFSRFLYSEWLAIAAIAMLAWCDLQVTVSDHLLGGGELGPTPSASAPPPVTVLGSGNVYGLYSGQFRLLFGLVSDFLSWYVCLAIFHAVMLA